MVFWGEWVVTKWKLELGRRAIPGITVHYLGHHRFRDKSVIEGHTLFVQRPWSRWNRESGVFKIPGETAKWVNNWEHKQT